MRNNPILYNDPTGHKESCQEGDTCQHLYSIAVKNVEYQKKVKKELVDAIRNFDLGDGTVEIDAGFNGFSRLFGWRGNFSLAIDFKGNIAFLRTIGGGGYVGAGGGLGLGITVTDAPSVSYLEGNDVEYGGQIGDVETVGAEFILFKGEDRNTYKGLSISQQEELLGPWPFEAHGTVTNTKIWGQLNIPSQIANFVDWIL